MALERRWLGLLGVGAVLAPKCPACLAGYLSLAGLGLGTATTVAPLLRPAGLAVAAVSAASIAWRLLRPRVGGTGSFVSGRRCPMNTA